jgi:hypothetical protein
MYHWKLQLVTDVTCTHYDSSCIDTFLGYHLYTSRYSKEQLLHGTFP